MDFTNFKKKMVKEGVYDDGNDIYIDVKNTRKILNSCKKDMLKIDEIPSLTDEEKAIIQERIIGYPVDEEDYDDRVVYKDKEIAEAEQEALEEKIRNHVKPSDNDVLRNTYAKLKNYMVEDFMNFQSKNVRELQQGEAQEIDGILKDIEHALTTLEEVERFPENNQNTAKQEYDKNGLDRSHLDGSKAHKEKTIAEMSKLIESEYYTALLKKMMIFWTKTSLIPM